MSLVASVVAAMLYGIVGGTVTATVLLYSDVPLNVTVQNQSYELAANEVRAVPIVFTVEEGNSTQMITVSDATISYEFLVTIIGEKERSWLWWLTPLPLVLIAGVWFIRRRAVGNS